MVYFAQDSISMEYTELLIDCGMTGHHESDICLKKYKFLIK